jgi:hypothetical protein
LEPFERIHRSFHVAATKGVLHRQRFERIAWFQPLNKSGQRF